MKLQEIFDQLRFGELSQIGIVDQVTGAIETDKHPLMLNHINLGLTALYKRFAIKESRAWIRLYTGLTIYPVTEDYAEMEDEGGLLVGSVLKIERVLTDTGTELNLNLDHDPYSCSTPTMNTLRVPKAIVNQDADIPDEVKTSMLEVIFRSKHPTLTMPTSGILVPSKVEVELPDLYLEALLYFVAARINNPIGMTNEFHAGNNYSAKYEAACQQLELQGLEVDQDTVNMKLSRNGWV